MVRFVIREVGRTARVCAGLGIVTLLASVASADAALESAPRASGLGLGGAYWFGLFAGMTMFGARYLLDQRKAHLAEYGK